MSSPSALADRGVAAIGSSAWIAGATVTIYVASSAYYLTGSLQVGDLWLVLAGMLILANPEAREGLARLLLGSYGFAGLALSGLALLALVHASNLEHSMSFVLQLLVCLWALVPVVAIGVARMVDPVRFIRQAGIAYLVVYFIGLVLLLGAGSDLLLYQSGIGRIFQRLSTLSLQLGLMAVAMGGLVAGSAQLRDATLLVLSMLPILLNASRTGLVAFAVLGMLGIAFSIGRLRQAPWVLAGLITVSVLAIVVSRSETVQALWSLRTLSSTTFLDDDIRVASYSISWQAISRSGLTLLFGNGWGTSGGEIVVHNIVLQVWHEAGILVLLALLVLLLLPVWWGVSRLRVSSATARVGIMIGLLNLVYWTFNAVSIERVYWLGYALALGMVIRPLPPRTAT